MLFEYIQKALEKAQYKVLEDGTWFAEIPGFEGVWANAKTVEKCRHELLEVLEEWLVLKIRDRDPIAEIEGVEISISVWFRKWKERSPQCRRIFRREKAGNIGKSLCNF